MGASAGRRGDTSWCHGVDVDCRHECSTRLESTPTRESRVAKSDSAQRSALQSRRPRLFLLVLAARA